MPRPRVPCSQSFPRSRLFVCRCLVVSPSLFVLVDAPWQETRRSILSTFAYSSQIYLEIYPPNTVLCRHSVVLHPVSVTIAGGGFSGHAQETEGKYRTRQEWEKKRDHGGENWKGNKETKPRERATPLLCSLHHHSAKPIHPMSTFINAFK